jgi:hypothetical protein
MDTHANASSAGAARAQAELIDLLARLVLASVEHSATAKEQEQTATQIVTPARAGVLPNCWTTQTTSRKIPTRGVFFLLVVGCCW